jgi:hypothetical protein
MSWMRIRLELARAPGFPEGSYRHGYEFILPLQAAGHFDKKAYDKTPELCTVHRFWEGEGDEVGKSCTRHGDGGRSPMLPATRMTSR